MTCLTVSELRLLLRLTPPGLQKRPQMSIIDPCLKSKPQVMCHWSLPADKPRKARRAHADLSTLNLGYTATSAPHPHPHTHTARKSPRTPWQTQIPPCEPPTPHQDTTPNNATRNPPATPCAPAMQT